MPGASHPFILLDDARATGAEPARLYRDPVEIVSAIRVEDIAPALNRLSRALQAGLHLAGFLTYEASAAFEPKLAGGSVVNGGGEPLLWFGLFEDFTSLDGAAVDDFLREAICGEAGAICPDITLAAYEDSFDRVKAYIEAGDIYQANLTFQSSVPVSGDPIGLYRTMRPKARAGYGALVSTGTQWILSFSPELFFTLDDRELLARPMKGTSVRGRDAEEDRRLAASLSSDPKQRAENLMIVDLLRNDLSRVAEPGSVKATRLFTVETYPTVLQMVSDVTATLRPGLSAIDVLRATFPCGSVTGAPKVRAMEIVAEVEHGPRGIYTGSIGRIDPDGSASFNVAIRTLSFAHGADQATIGLGSAIVADSECDAEWRECMNKARFLQPG